MHSTEKGEAGYKAGRLLRSVRDFDFLFYVKLLNLIFSKTGVLHTYLQTVELNIETALELAFSTTLQLVELKNDQLCDSLLREIVELADLYLIDPPSLTNQRGRPRKRQRTDSNQNESEFDPMEKYKKIYQETLDCFINHLSEKFSVENYKPLISISKILTATNENKPEESELFWDLNIYRQEIDFNMLQSELSTWIAYKSANNLNESLKTINSVRLFFVSKNLKNVFPNLFIYFKYF
jgi:hypothetical protein